MRFAFAGRCSTEDNQDPETSRAWQLTRARSLIEPHGGVVVAEYFDAGLSRSIPWQRRPEAAQLLTEIKRTDRGFDAVVIGEPQRAFYGNQFGNTFPIFEHFAVPLWVPEIGGPIDPANEAHDLIMSVFSGVSKGERNRVKTRVRTAMAAQTKLEGRFLGGRPPYGYQLIDLGPHPHPAKAAEGKRLHGLAPDPQTAWVVARIFTEFIQGFGIFKIAEGLTRDGILSPSAYDRKRNPHRTGIAWSKSAVRTILRNPRYTGFQVWNKQRKTEVLMDLDDVSLGHVTAQRWNPAAEWVRSDQLSHEAIIDTETFETAQAIMPGREKDRTERNERRVKRPYQFRGRLRCGICERKMQGQWIHDQSYYRCRYAEEYALAEHIAHPRNVYLPEAAFRPAVDGWLATAFAPHRLKDTVIALARAAGNDAQQPHHRQAEKAITECDRKLAAHRRALEAGADPVVVTQWITETQQERNRAQEILRNRPAAAAEALTEEQITALVEGLSDMVGVIGDADPALKAEIYAGLGVTATYEPAKNRLRVEASPDPRSLMVRVRGGT